MLRVASGTKQRLQCDKPSSSIKQCFGSDCSCQSKRYNVRVAWISNWSLSLLLSLDSATERISRIKFNIGNDIGSAVDDETNPVAWTALHEMLKRGRIKSLLSTSDREQNSRTMQMPLRPHSQRRTRNIESMQLHRHGPLR